MRPELQAPYVAAEQTRRGEVVLLLDPMPVSPPRARLLGTYDDRTVAEQLYGNPDFPIVRYGADQVEIQYGSLLPQWQPLFPEGASQFELGLKESEYDWKPITDQQRGGMVIGYYRGGSYKEFRNTDGEFMGAYEPGLEHGIPIIDPALDLVEKALKQAGYFVVGTVDSWLEDNWAALGLPPHERPLATMLGIPPDATAYQLGRGAGHLLALLQAAAEIVGGAALVVTGAGEFMAGVATTPEGIGFVVMPVGVVTMAAGTTIVIHGGALGAATFKRIGGGGGGAGGPRKLDFNQALNKALEKCKITRGDSIPNPDKFNPGRSNGRRSIDGKRGFRVEFDERHGAHINWWNEKTKGTIEFDATKETVEQIIKRFN